MQKLNLLFLCYAVYFVANAQTEKTTVNQLTEELEQIHTLGHINGFSVSIVSSDSILYTQGFGYSDIVQKKPYTANTIQNIASISKTMIGISLVKAQNFQNACRL